MSDVVKGKRIVRCSFFFLHQMLVGDGHKCGSDIPRDVEVVGVFQSDMDRTMAGAFSIIVESEDWEPLGEGQMIPILDVTFWTLETPDA